MAWDIGTPFPYLPSLEHAGGLPGVAATMPELNFAGVVRSMEISGTLGMLAYENAVAGSYANLRNSYLPSLSFEGGFGYELWVDGELPDLQGAFVTGGDMAASLAVLDFDGVLKREVRFNLGKNLPGLTFSGQTGWPLSGDFPSLDYTGIITLENRWNVSGYLPQIKYSTVQSLVYSSSISAKISPISYEGAWEIDQIGSIDKDLPALLGSFAMEARDGFTLDEKLAVLEYAGILIGNPYYDIDGVLPQLNASGRMEPEVDTDDLIPASDGVIRHRRWS